MYTKAGQERSRRPDVRKSASAMPRTQARTNEIAVIQTSSQAPTRNACLWSRTGVQLIWYAISMGRAAPGRAQQPALRPPFPLPDQVVIGTCTPFVPTTDVARWYFTDGGTTHFFQPLAIV